MLLPSPFTTIHRKSTVISSNTIYPYAIIWATKTQDFNKLQVIQVWSISTVQPPVIYNIQNFQCSSSLEIIIIVSCKMQFTQSSKSTLNYWVLQ